MPPIRKLARVSSVALHGIHAQLVSVEANIGPGLPGLHVVGLADTSVRESRERIKTAAANCGIAWPRTKVIISLSPADMPKAGSHFDLAITLAVLAAQAHDDEVAARLAGVLVVGEIGLDGAIKPVPGVLAAILRARECGIAQVIVPEETMAEAALATGIDVRCVATLRQAHEWLFQGRPLPRVGNIVASGAPPHYGDFSDVAGQDHAEFGAQVAAAGGHHLLMIGPPGSGKSMIAQRMAGLLPPLGPDEVIEATIVHSIAGNGSEPITRAPFVAPHHSITRSGLLGGGSGTPRPGAVSLAHCGVLFLDEVSEIPARILDGLRTPLEQHSVRIVRAHREYRFPARCQLVLAANPCRCGAEEPHECRCSAQTRRTYLENLSGPLRDRLDIMVSTHGKMSVLSDAHATSTADIAQAVALARERATARWVERGLDVTTNAQVEGTVLRREFPATEAAMAMLGAFLARGEMSQRGVDRTLKIAWTLADLAGCDIPDVDHVAAALDLRGTPTIQAAA